MRVAYKRGSKGKSIEELFHTAKELEQNGELQEAAKIYQQITQDEPANETAYARLMIIYRKEKDYKKELQIINSAIKSFDQQLLERKRTHPNKKVNELSLAFMKSTGLTDKKGNPLYLPEPLGNWNRRKAIVEKKLKKK